MVEHLAKSAPVTLKWAIAGRSRAKLEALKQEIRVLNPDIDVAIIIADSHDQESLEAMVSQTRVILTTVGPFDVHGELLVASCVKLGTDYVDSTGETPFVRRMAQKYHDAAQAKSVFITHCCGFDCVPSDLAAYL